MSRLSGVRNYEMTLLNKWEKPFFSKLDLRYLSQADPPCGMLPYCTRCPSNPNYDGTVWNNQRLFRELVSETNRKNSTVVRK